MKRPVLTPREFEIINGIALGKSNTEIASDLFLSINTIKTHIQRLYRKMGTANRCNAIHLANEFGLLVDIEETAPRTTQPKAPELTPDEPKITGMPMAGYIVLHKADITPSRTTAIRQATHLNSLDRQARRIPEHGAYALVHITQK